MKNKILVSLLLIFLIAISASAVSASEDITDTIAETSDSTELGLNADDATNTAISEDLDEENLNVIDTDNGNFNEDESVDTITNQNKNKLGDEPKVYISNNYTITNVDGLKWINKYDGYNRFLLGNNTFNLTSPFTITKSCIIEGGIFKAETLDYFFNIESPSNGGPSSVTIKDVKFIITKEEQKVVFAKGNIEGVNHVLNIAGVTLENITLEIIEEISPNSVSLLYINEYPSGNSYSNEINLIDNILNNAIGININGIPMDVTHLDATEIIYPKQTRIFAMDMIGYAVDQSVGDSPLIYQVTLRDEYGQIIPNKTIKFGIDEFDEITAITDSYGIATLKLPLSSIRDYTVVSFFEGAEDQGYKPSGVVVNTIHILKKDSNLIVKNLSYKVTATKKLTATFKSPNLDEYGRLIGYKVIKNKKVTFTVNGKTCTATTNSKGVATVKITLNKKGTYYYYAKFAGDSMYNAVSKKAKLTVVPLAASLTAAKYSYKKATKTKRLKTVLKSGKTVLKYQKVTFRVNGKNYVAKTNSKGIAIVKVKLTKKGTYKYSVKYAGNNKYKAVSRTNKVVIK